MCGHQGLVWIRHRSCSCMSRVSWSSCGSDHNHSIQWLHIHSCLKQKHPSRPLSVFILNQSNCLLLTTNKWFPTFNDFIKLSVPHLNSCPIGPNHYRKHPTSVKNLRSRPRNLRFRFGTVDCLIKITIHLISNDFLHIKYILVYSSVQKWNLCIHTVDIEWVRVIKYLHTEFK